MSKASHLFALGLSFPTVKGNCCARLGTANSGHQSPKSSAGTGAEPTLGVAEAPAGPSRHTKGGTRGQTQMLSGDEPLIVRFLFENNTGTSKGRGVKQ